MTVAELHPEDLLDKDARGELTLAEEERLEAHLARCSACRAERMLRGDFLAELEGDDRPSAILGLVAGALRSPDAEAALAKAEAETARAKAEAEASAIAQAAEEAARLVAEQKLADLTARAAKAMSGDPPPEPELRAGPTAEVLAIPGMRKPRRAAIVLLCAAAAIMAASVAGATGLTARVWTSLRGGDLEATHGTGNGVVPSPTTLAVGSSGREGGRAGERAEPRAEERADLAAATTTDVATPAATALAASGEAKVAEPVRAAPLAARPSFPTSGSAAPGSAGVMLRPVSFEASSGESTGAAAGASQSASALFDAANTARRLGDHRTALAQYDALEQAYPTSREARLAKATSGRLLLDVGDAAGAVRRFDAYLASGAGELREEAMAGRATALERLGRDEDESRAWALLLATYPHTPYAAHARARVGRSLPQ